MLNKIVHTYWTRLLTTAFVFASVVLTSRFLGAEGKGVTSLLVTNILLITLLNDLVGGVSLIYLVPRYPLISLVVPTALFSLVCSLIAAVVFHFLGIIPPEYSVHLYFLAVLQSFNNIALNVLLGKEQIRVYNYLALFKAFLNAALLIIYFMAMHDASVTTFIHALYISNAAPLFFAVPVVMRYWNDIPRQGSLSFFKELITYGSQSQFANIVQMLNYRLSFYLLNALLLSEGKKAVGVFSIALALADVIWMMSKSIGTVQLTRIANMMDTQGIQEAHALTKKFLRFSILSTVLLLIPALLMPSEVYTFIFGSEFGDTRQALLMMAAGILIFSINIILANHFAGTGRYSVNTIASLVGLVINIPANILLIPKFGLMGAGIAASITFAVTTLYTWIQFARESSLGWKDLVVSREDVRKLVALAGRGTE